MKFREEMLWEEGSAELYTERNNVRLKVIEEDLRKVVYIMWKKAHDPRYYGSMNKPASADDIVTVMLRDRAFKCTWVYTKPSVKKLYIQAATSLKPKWDPMVFKTYYKKILKAAGASTVIPNSVKKLNDNSETARYDIKRNVVDGKEVYVKEEFNFFPY